MKTSELIGPALDWAVAKAQGWTDYPNDSIECGSKWHCDPEKTPFGRVMWKDHFTPSTDWSQGGPIICQEITKVFRNVGGTWSAMILKDVPIPPEDRGTSLALTRRAQWNGAGPTPLIAAMRCFCCSKLGDVVEVPGELL